jgi:PadR family transcriptional regulator PadR
VASSRRPSPQTVGVLGALAGDPQTWRYGYELAAEVGLRSGSLYPILVRLSDRDLLESRWEPAPVPGRPPRHLYRLTAGGLDYATRHTAASTARTTSRASRAPRLTGA